MFKRSKRFMSLFVACSMLLSILGGAVDAAVATLLSPRPGDATGKIVDVSVKYDSQSKVKIDTVVLYVDNAIYEKKKLSAPAQKGVVSFDWNTQAYSKGQHYIEVKLFANGKLVTSVNGAGVVSDTVFDVVAPKVSLANVVDGEVVSGTKTIRINAKDDSGQAPIVSLLVDKKLKLMQNTQPYAYNLDTTAMTDGKHVVEVYAFDFEGNQSDIVSYTINVNNGSVVAEAPVVVNENTVKANVPTENKEQKLASRPSVNKNTNTQVGRVSEKDLNASVSVINTNPLVSGKGVLNSPSITEETTKIIVKDPVVTKVASNPISNNNTTNLKLTTTLKTSELSLNAPKVTQEAVVKDPTTVLVAKRISDNNVVASELKLATSTKNAELTLNAPTTVSVKEPVKEPVSVKTPVKEPAVSETVLVSKSVSYNNTNNTNLKLTSTSSNPSVSINEPTMVKTEVVAPVAKAEVKTPVKENIDTPKAKVEVKAQSTTLVKENVDTPKAKVEVKAQSTTPVKENVDTPKAKVEVKAQATTPVKENVDTPKADAKCDKPCPKADAKCDKPCPKADAKCDKPCPKADAKCDKPCPKADAKCDKPCPKANCPKGAPCSKDGKAKLRDIVNCENGTLFWDNKTKTVTAYVNNCKVEMKIGSKKVKVNGNPMTINLVPQLKNGRTIIDVTEFKKLTAPSLKD